jgi:hypothetical protein
VRVARIFRTEKTVGLSTAVKEGIKRIKKGKDKDVGSVKKYR